MSEIYSVSHRIILTNLNGLRVAGFQFRTYNILCMWYVSYMTELRVCTLQKETESKCYMFCWRGKNEDASHLLVWKNKKNTFSAILSTIFSLSLSVSISFLKNFIFACCTQKAAYESNVCSPNFTKGAKDANNQTMWRFRNECPIQSLNFLK